MTHTARGIRLAVDVVTAVAVEVTWWHPDATVEVVLLLCAFSNIAQILSEIRRMA